MTTAHSIKDLGGIALALSTAVGFALSNVGASMAYDAGSNPMTISAVRFITPTLVLIAWLVSTGVRWRLPKGQMWTSIGLGLITAIYTWGVLSAVSMIPLALAILVFYLFPLVAALILGVFGWERLGWPTIGAIILAFVGLVLALTPRGDALEFAGVLAAFIGALGLGTVIAVSSQVFKSGDSRPVTLHMAAVAGAILLVACFSQGQFAMPQTGLGWLGLAASSICYAYAMIAFYIAVSMIGPAQVALLCYAEPVLAAILGAVLLSQPLGAVEVAGIAIVISALVGSTLLRQRRRAPA